MLPEGNVIVGSGPRKAHVRWDCPSVGMIENPRVKPLAVLFDDTEFCKRCSP